MSLLKIFPRWFWLSCLCLTLCACGFQLRGQAALPPKLHVLYLQTAEPYSQFTKKLQQTLQSIGIKLVDDPKAAPMTLEIVSNNFSQQLASISPTSQIRQYIITDTVIFQIKNREGQVLVPPQAVSATRTHTLNSNQVLGDTSTQASLRESIERDVIYQIVNRLGSHATAKALK